MARRVKLDNYAVPAAPRLGLTGWLRWSWRQVTSMRVALVLLLLLGLAAIPGSLLPQWPQDPAGARGFLANNGALGETLDALGFLDVFGSAWFSAIYVLLMLSLVGCIVPRIGRYWRELRRPPAAAPSSLARYDTKAEAKVPDAAAALDRVAATLRRSGHRVRVEERTVRGRPELALAAEQGHWRELGNLVFHVGIVFIIVIAVVGSFLTYRGQAVVVEGRTFTNTVVAYDTFEPGRGFDPARLDPFTVTLDRLDSTFDLQGRALDFEAFVTVTESDGALRADTIRVNHPLEASGARLFLAGNGYAPEFTVTDSDGFVAFAGAVPFLPQDQVYTSTGVVKVPDVTSGEQIGIRATLLPSAVIDGENAFSIHPDPANPIIAFEVLTGDLGLDDGVPQNVYVLDDSRLSPLRTDDGEIAVFVIAPGQTVELPDGLGAVTWDALPRFAAIDIHADPTLPYLLASALLTLAGLTLSLFGSRRRLWVIGAASGAATVVGAAHAPHFDAGLQGALDRALAAAEEDS